MLNFFQHVLPTDGPYVLLVFKKTKSGVAPLQTAFSTVEGLCAEAAKQTGDVYFCVGSVANSKADGLRAKANIKYQRSFFVDIDFKDFKCDNPLGMAVSQLQVMCSKVGIPMPTMVNSGGGLHGYWSCRHNILPYEWTDTANKLKAILIHEGVTFDRTRTADIASILRVPGTINTKYEGAVRATLISELQPHILYEDFKCKIDQFCTVNNITISSKQTVSTGEMSFTTNDGVVPLHFIVNNCAQIRNVYIQRGNVSRDLWRAAIDISRFTEEGMQAAIDMSNGYAGWSEGEIAKEINYMQGLDLPPRSCAWFRANNPTGCEGCTQKVGSPANARYIPIHPVIAPQPESVCAIEPTKEIEPPWPYLRKFDSRGNMSVFQRDYDQNNKELDPIQVIPYDLYAVDRLFDEFVEVEYALFEVKLPNDKTRRIKIRASDVVDRRQLAKALSDKGVYSPDYTGVQLYMLAYIQSMQTSSASELQVSKMGWRDETNFTEFAIGSRVLRKIDSGVSVVSGSFNPGMKRLFASMKTEGDLDSWKKGFDIYNRPGMEAFAFVALSGFASPLLSFIPGIKGIVVSLFGKSGQGKTWCAGVVNSIWGSSDVGLASTRTQDTSLSKEAKMGVLNSLPVIYDESTNTDPKDISNFCLNVSSGQGKDGMNKDNTFRAIVHTWCTIVYTTTNNSWASKLATIKGDAEAESMRLFEFELSHENNTLLSKADADHHIRLLSENYGHAGAVFMAYVLGNIDQVRKAVQETKTKVDNRLGNNSQERYWSALIAVTTVAASITKKLGLHTYDVPTVINWSIKKANEMRDTVKSEVITPMEVLGKFINSNLNSSIFLNLVRGEIVWDGKVPATGKVVIRHELFNDRIFIDRDAISTFISSLGMDVNRVKSELISKGVLLDAQCNKRMLAHTKVSGGQMRVWMIDTSNVNVSGVLQSVLTPTDVEQRGVV